LDVYNSALSDAIPLLVSPLSSQVLPAPPTDDPNHAECGCDVLSEICFQFWFPLLTPSVTLQHLSVFIVWKSRWNVIRTAVDFLERLVSNMTFYLLSGTLNSAHSHANLIHFPCLISLYPVLCKTLIKLFCVKKSNVNLYSALSCYISKALRYGQCV